MSQNCTYTLAALDINGHGPNALYVSVGVKYGNVGKSIVFLIDPADITRCVPAADADDHLLDRCSREPLCFAWVPDWFVQQSNVALVPSHTKPDVVPPNNTPSPSQDQ